LPGHERELAQVWADALGIPAGRIRGSDNFFEIGGTSRTAARLVITLEQQLSLSELAQNATLARMAGLLQQRREDARDGATSG